MRTTLLAMLLLLPITASTDFSPLADNISGPPALVAHSGDLVKPIDDYTGDEFYSHVRGLTYTGEHERERRCRGCTNQRTRVALDAVSDEDSLSSSDLPEFGTVAVRGRNLGGRVENMYGMRPGARYEYYLIVLPTPNPGESRWRLEELEIRGHRYSHRPAATGRIFQCNHPFQPGAMADFRTCARDVEPVSTSIAAQGGPDGDPIWYRCAFGCCVAEEDSET